MTTTPLLIAIIAILFFSFFAFFYIEDIYKTGVKKDLGVRAMEAFVETIMVCFVVVGFVVIFCK